MSVFGLRRTHCCLKLQLGAGLWASRRFRDLIRWKLHHCALFSFVALQFISPTLPSDCCSSQAIGCIQGKFALNSCPVFENRLLCTPQYAYPFSSRKTNFKRYTQALSETSLTIRPLHSLFYCQRSWKSIERKRLASFSCYKNRERETYFLSVQAKCLYVWGCRRKTSSMRHCVRGYPRWGKSVQRGWVPKDSFWLRWLQNEIPCVGIATLG